MTCPKCGSKQSDKAVSCTVCGYSVDVEKNSNTTKKSLFSRMSKKAKILILGIVILIILIPVILLILNLTGNKGIRKSEKLAKKIGDSIVKASDYAKVELQQVSGYDFLDINKENSLIYEASSDTDVYGVEFPSWIIVCTEDMFGNLVDVTYYNFQVLSDNINGVKKESKIDISGIKPGVSEKESDDILDMEPYQIYYQDGTKVKKYKYYFKNNSTHTIDAYYITVMFNDKGTVNAPVIEEINDFISDILKTTDN